MASVNCFARPFLNHWVILRVSMMMSCPSPQTDRSGDGRAPPRSTARLYALCIAAWTQCTYTWTNRRARLDALAGRGRAYQNSGPRQTCGMAGEKLNLYPIPRRLRQCCTERWMVFTVLGAKQEDLVVAGYPGRTGPLEASAATLSSSYSHPGTGRQGALPPRSSS